MAAAAHPSWDFGSPYRIVLFYRYFEADIETLQSVFTEICTTLGMLGRVLIAREGVNGTFAASHERMDAFIKQLEQYSCFSRGKVDWKFSDCEASNVLPFQDLSIRIVKSIIAAGPEGDRIISRQIKYDDTTFGGLDGGGVHLSPKEWNDALTERPVNSLLIDIRNEFESDVGNFHGSIPIKTSNYTETWKNLDSICGLDKKGKTEKEPPQNIFMYCTGGIRCEKASAYLRAKMPEASVFQLQGGIHRYLEEYGENGLFQGKNYTFDSRIDHNAAILDDTQCQVEGEKAVIKKVPLGKCLYCEIPYDTYSGNCTCTVCRALILVCTVCAKCHEEYHCKAHFALRKCYYTILDIFTPAELTTQRDQLMRLHDAMLPPPKPSKEEAKAAAANKIKRNTILKQVQRVEGQLSLLESGVTSVVMDSERRQSNPQVAWWVRQQREREGKIGSCVVLK